MRTMTPSPTPDGAESALSQSALQLTRAAIARWRGKPPVGALPRGLYRISAQARHLALAQRGLADWIAQGGFSQDEEIVPPLLLQWQRPQVRADACVD